MIFFVVFVIDLWLIMILRADHTSCNFIEINKYKQLTLLRLQIQIIILLSVRIHRLLQLNIIHYRTEWTHKMTMSSKSINLANLKKITAVKKTKMKTSIKVTQTQINLNNVVLYLIKPMIILSLAYNSAINRNYSMTYSISSYKNKSQHPTNVAIYLYRINHS
jgi:hypothetical protein